MKDRRLIGAVIAALAIGAASVASAQALNDAQLDNWQQRIDLINRMTNQFQAEAAAQAGTAFNAREWKRDFGARMLYQSPQALSAALGASDIASAQAALAIAAGKPQPKHTADDNLLLHAITPCRVADTRGAVAGIMPGGVWRDFSVLAPPATIAAQGGAAAGCPLPTGVQGFVLLVSVVPTGVFGGSTPNFLTVQHSSLVGPPSTASMTYYPGAIDSALAMALCNGSCPSSASGSVAVFTSGSTHVIIDWVGWLGSAAQVALDCQTVTNTFNIPASGAGGAYFSESSGNCPAGYAVTGGGLSTNFGTATLYYYNSSPEPVAAPTHWRCTGRNVDYNAIWSATCNVICCRSPALAP